MNAKRIVIIHSHLNPGGVTRIIESQILALKMYNPSMEIMVLTGACPDTFNDDEAKIVCNPCIDYLLNQGDFTNRLDHIYNSVSDLFYTNIGKDDIVHVHNLNLGKNPLVTYCLFKMAERGYNIFNHCHDFAEDRPDNYKFLATIIEDKLQKDMNYVLYPDLPNYRFGVLNSFDKKRLISYQVNDDKITLLPNPVELNTNCQTLQKEQARQVVQKCLSVSDDKLIVTYPVRVIRRKNIGEFILLTLLFQKRANWLVTLPPKNPAEIVEYNRWKKFCDKQHIPVIFEAGNHCGFIDIISASDYCITTSRMEGFGMAYMEPWLMDTPVIGRNLSMITDDLIQAGMNFPCLYDQLLVDVSGEHYDFKDLKVKEQMAFIKSVRKDERHKQSVFALNPWLNQLFSPVSETFISNNKNTIKTNFSLSKYGERLYNDVYSEFS